MQDLGTLGNATRNSHGMGINIHDEVTGDSITADGTQVHAFRKLSTDTSLIDLGTLESDHVTGNSYGTGINDVGDVSGKSNYTSDHPVNFYGFWYHGSTMDALQGPNGSDSYANAIDNSSTSLLVGAARGYYVSGCSYNYNHAYSWTGASSQNPVGSLDGEEAHAFGLNAGGIVVGDTSVGGICQAMPIPHAFFAVPDIFHPPTYTFTQLDANAGSWITQSRAFGINGNANSYQIVGQYGYTSPASGNLTDSFLYDSTSGSLTDLGMLLPPNSGWSNLLAYAINGSGWIVGQGKYTDPGTGNAYHHAFLMKPPGTSPGPSGHSGSPPLVDPNTSQGSASNALLLSGAPANAPLGATGLGVPAPLAPEHEDAAGMTGSTATAATAVPVLPAPSAVDSLFTAPNLEWTGGLGRGPLG
jgi:hypothetical protein